MGTQCLSSSVPVCLFHDAPMLQLSCLARKAHFVSGKEDKKNTLICEVLWTIAGLSYWDKPVTSPLSSRHSSHSQTRLSPLLHFAVLDVLKED